MKDHPQTTTVVVACVLAWAITWSVSSRTGKRLLSAATRVGFELLGGADMLVGIG